MRKPARQQGRRFLQSEIEMARSPMSAKREQFPRGYAARFAEKLRFSVSFNYTSCGSAADRPHTPLAA
jgi:hypothetical protein